MYHQRRAKEGCKCTIREKSHACNLLSFLKPYYRPRNRKRKTASLSQPSTSGEPIRAVHTTSKKTSCQDLFKIIEADIANFSPKQMLMFKQNVFQLIREVASVE